jgi:hypothetical protein
VPDSTSGVGSQSPDGAHLTSGEVHPPAHDDTPRDDLDRLCLETFVQVPRHQVVRAFWIAKSTQRGATGGMREEDYRAIPIAISLSMVVCARTWLEDPPHVDVLLLHHLPERRNGWTHLPINLQPLSASPTHPDGPGPPDGLAAPVLSWTCWPRASVSR